MSARTLVEAVFGTPSGNYLPGKGEHIVAAAVRATLTGDVFLGDWHAEAAMLAHEHGLFIDDYDDGFWTSAGRFVTRDQASMIARRARQGDVLPGQLDAGEVAGEGAFDKIR